MTLVRHLLVADVRRFQSTLISWVALVVITTVLDAAAPELVPGSSLALGVTVASTLLSVATILYFVAVVAVVVQNHSVVGTTAFWFAKPIPPLSLFACKALLLVGLLVAVPVACDVVLMAVHHVPVSRMLLVVLQTVLVRTLAIALLMSVAATTANLTRFTLVCVAALVGIGLVGVLSLSLLLGQWSGGGRMSVLSTPQGGGPIDVAARTFDHTPDALGIMLVTIAAVLMLRSQYLVRQVRRSVSLGVAGAAIAILIAAFWPWPLFVPRQAVPPWANNAGAAVLGGNAASFGFDWGLSYIRDDVRLARADTRVTGFPDGWFATARLAGASLAIPGHPDLTSLPYGPAAFLVQQNGSSLLSLALAHALGVSMVATSGTAGADRLVTFVTREGQLSARQPASGNYVGNFVLDLTRLERVAAMPLEPGIFQDGDFRFQVKEVRTENDGLYLRTKISETQTIFDRRPPAAYLYFLVNYDRDQALSGYDTWRRGNAFGLPAALPAYWFPPGFSLESTSMQFSVRGSVHDKNQRDFVAEWIANARLVLIKATGVGAVMREVRLPDVKTTVELPRRRQ